HHLDLASYVGGHYATIFLTPAGYHHVHMPADGEVLDCRHIPGRYFPQNEDALEHIDRVYERNERAVLRCRTNGGVPFLAVMVGASLIGGIHLAGLERTSWVGPHPVTLARRVAKGDRLGHFTFGSTVVLLLARGAAGPLVAEPGTSIRMGQTIWAP